MATYNIYPAVDETYNFPTNVRKALVNSTELQSKLEEKTVAYKRALVSGDDFDKIIEPGYYHATLYSISQNLINTPHNMNMGTLKVERNAFTGVTQTYSWTEGYNQPRVMQRTFNPGTSKGAWTSINNYPTPLEPGADVKTIKAPGIHEAVTSARAADLINLPEAVKGQPGFLNVTIQYYSATAYRLVREWTTFPYAVGQPPRTFVQSETNVGQHSDWQERAYIKDVNTGSPTSGNAGNQYEVANRRELLLQQSRLRHAGQIGVGDKTPVGLSFDHGYANFRDLVLPHLIRLGLPHSSAVNTSGLGTGESEGVTMDILQNWSINHGTEMMNHGFSHRDAVTPEAMESDIVGALHDLQAGMPKVTIDGFIMPGVAGTLWDGFASGVVPSKWYTHPAGRMIVDNHAVITSALLGQATPMNGTPITSVDRAGIDTNSWVTLIQNRITSLQGTGMGIQIFNHPSLINTEGRISLDRLVGFLEWLAEQRDLGNIEVLTASGFGWASTLHDKRPDISKGVWTNNSATLTLAPLREWAAGSQWMLSVESSAASNITLTVKDDTGALNKTVTQTVKAKGTARACFTIPLDTLTLTMTATTSAGTLSGHRVNAV